MPANNEISLYIHLPWCVKKCPYCDFNSHELRSNLDEKNYVSALLNDLAFESQRLSKKPIIKSIFIGGGTPSLFSATAIGELLTGVDKLVTLNSSSEITLEANPGTADERRFRGYYQAGVNRLSIGVQSFNDKQLGRLGRIHDRRAALSAIEMADNVGFTNYNLDLMYGLPEQDLTQALADVSQAIALKPAHISAYQLTLEPNTLFAVRPPVLPDDETAWQIQQAYWTALDESGYRRYEISAYSQSGYQCVHNLNYWQFGDYLGVGAGAHGKLTIDGVVFRTRKPKHPARYLDAFSCQPEAGLATLNRVSDKELPLEYMMNILRLTTGFSLNQFEQSTGLDRSSIAQPLRLALEKNLLVKNAMVYRPSEKGRLFLDDLLQLFLPDNHQEVA